MDTPPDQVVTPETTWHMFMAFLEEMAERARQRREAAGEKTSDDFTVEDLPAAAQAMVKKHPERKAEIMKEFAAMRTDLARTQPKQTP